MGKIIKLPFNNNSVVSVGWTGQNEYEEVTFDISVWLKKFPTGVVRVFYKLNTDGNLYPIADITSDTYIWKPQAADFPKPGRYSAQAIMESGTTIGKSDIFYFDIKKSLDHLNQISDDPPPEYPPSYIQKIMQDMEAYAQRAESAAEHIPYYEDGKLYVWDEDTQQFVEFSLDIDDAVEKYFDKHPIEINETDPTVPGWAKNPTKPTYTAAEVGALPSSYTPPVESVNGKTGAVVLDAEDVGALPADTPIPAAVTVDSALSETSENPVQNKVVNAALQSKGTYSKPSGGIPASDLASDVIPVVPQMATAADMSDWTGGKTVDAAVLRTDFQSAIQVLINVGNAVDHHASEIGNLQTDKADKTELPDASTSTPVMDGTAAVGSSAAYARGDHVHPSDTTRLSTTGNAYRSASIPMGHLDATSTATVMTATVDGITELRDGVCMWLQNGVITSASGFTLNVNGLGAKPCYSSLAAASRSTTIFNVNYTMLFLYNSTRVSGGCWDIVYGVDTNTTYTPVKLGFGYGTCTTAAATAAKTASISSYALTTGGIVSIKFDNDVPANATLNITSKGAKAIYHRGAAITAGVIKAGDTATFVYNTYYHLIAIDRDESGDVLPSVTASDNGKVLGVVNGAWAVKSDEGGSSVTVDDALSPTSTNPVQNKVVKAALDAKADASSLAAKQDALTAGQNVTISGNTISADVDSAEIASNVTNWLNTNVNPVGSAVVVDSSLTVDGAAADANVTGDGLRGIYDGQKQIAYTTEAGYYSASGEIYPDTAAVKSVHTNNIPVVAGQKLHVELEYTTTRSMWLTYVVFTESGTFITRAIPLVGSVDRQSYSGDVTISKGVGFISFTYRTYGEAQFSIQTAMEYDGEQLKDGSVGFTKFGDDFKAETRNLFRGEWENSQYNSSGVLIPAGVLHAACPPDTVVDPNTAYTVSWYENEYTGSISNLVMYIMQFDANGSRVVNSNYEYSRGEATFTTNASAAYLGFMIYCAADAASDWTMYVPSKIQVEKGNEKTAYIAPFIIRSDILDISAIYDEMLPELETGVAVLHQTRNVYDGTWEHSLYNSSGVLVPTTSISHASCPPTIPVEPNTKYTVSWYDCGYTGSIDNLTFYIMQADVNGNRVAYSSYSYKHSEQTLTTNASTAYLGFMVYCAADPPSSWDMLIPSKMQVEKGGAKTTYVPPRTVDTDELDIESIYDEMSDNVAETVGETTALTTLASLTVKTIAHRGDDIAAPQCTVPSYIAARKRGIMIAENDLALSEDGQLIVWHDTSLSLLGNLVDINGYLMYTDGTNYYWVNNGSVFTWNGSDYVASSVALSGLTRCVGSAYGVNSANGKIGLNLDVLKRIDFGVYKGAQFKGTQILTFAEWVLLCKQLGMEIYVDHKLTYTDAIIEEAASTVLQYGMSEHASWLDLGTSGITKLREYIPDARCGTLSHPSDSLIAQMQPYNVGRGFFFNGDGKTMVEADIRKGLLAGFDVEVWFVDYGTRTEAQILETIRQAVSYGCTAVSLDHYRVADAFADLLN